MVSNCLDAPKDHPQYLYFEAGSPTYSVREKACIPFYTAPFLSRQGFRIIQLTSHRACAQYELLNSYNVFDRGITLLSPITPGSPIR